jgi:hypothetical protein
MTSDDPNTPPQRVLPEHIPVLNATMILNDVPEVVRIALDARAAEKKALLALSGELVQNLRPEIERLTAELVERTLQGVWEKRARMYQDH